MLPILDCLSVWETFLSDSHSAFFLGLRSVDRTELCVSSELKSAMHSFYPSELPIRLNNPLSRNRTMAAVTLPPSLGFCSTCSSSVSLRHYKRIREALANVQNYCAIGTSWFLHNRHVTTHDFPNKSSVAFLSASKVPDRYSQQRDDDSGLIDIVRADSESRQKI